MAEKNTDRGVASTSENDALQHTEGGTTTRRDAGDLGVPMLPGKGDEPVGPEDALGEGPKRGQYADRIGPSNYLPHEVRRDVVDGTPQLVVEAQRPRVDDLGDGVGKGGVTPQPGA